MISLTLCEMFSPRENLKSMLTLSIDDCWVKLSEHCCRFFLTRWNHYNVKQLESILLTVWNGRSIFSSAVLSTFIWGVVFHGQNSLTFLAHIIQDPVSLLSVLSLPSHMHMRFCATSLLPMSKVMQSFKTNSTSAWRDGKEKNVHEWWFFADHQYMFSLVVSFISSKSIELVLAILNVNKICALYIAIFCVQTVWKR